MAIEQLFSRTVNSCRLPQRKKARPCWGLGSESMTGGLRQGVVGICGNSVIADLWPLVDPEAMLVRA